MREIKFRVWSKSENLMGEVTGFRFSKSQYPFVNARFRKNGETVDEGYHFGQEDGCDNVILMQFTGLYDKNGKEIYEGDIVKVGDDYEVYGLMASEVREVYFGYGGFRLKSKNPEYKGCWLEDGKDVEVIGNIYENHELLKEGNV